MAQAKNQKFNFDKEIAKRNYPGFTKTSKNKQNG